VELPRDYTLKSHWPDGSGMVAGIESECRPDSRRNGGRFPVGIVAGFGRNTHYRLKPLNKEILLLPMGQSWTPMVGEFSMPIDIP